MLQSPAIQLHLVHELGRTQAAQPPVPIERTSTESLLDLIVRRLRKLASVTRISIPNRSVSAA